MSQTPVYPLSKDEIGNADWKVLHTYAAQWPNKPTAEDKKEFHYLVRSIIKTLPEGECKCRTHAVEFIQKKNPKMNNRKELVEWLCHFHNDVNKHAGKKEVDCKEVIHNAGDCPTCKVKPKEEREKEKTVSAADRDGPLKEVLGDYKKLSIKVFEELCHKEGIPVPKIIFSPCPKSPYTSCTTFLIDKNKQMIKQGGEGKEPVVYINPTNFGLRVLVHEWHEYERQMKAEGHYKPDDEETVERHTQEVLRKYFPADYYDKEKQQLVQPIVMKDEIMAAPVQEEKPKPFSFRNRKSHRESFTTDEFPMFTKYRDKQRQAQMEELEASKAESAGMLSYFDALYEPFAKAMNIKARDLNLANTPNIFAGGAQMALNSQLTTFGSLAASTLLGLLFFATTVLNKDGMGIADRILLANLGGLFTWSGLQHASSPAIRETAAQVGTHLANMEFDAITKLMVNPNSVFAGITESQAQQQAGVQRRVQQRASSPGAVGIGAARGNTPSGPVSPAQSVIERVQERALNPEGNQPESVKLFKNFPSPAAGGAVPRTDSGGGRSFTYVPTPVTPYDMPQDEVDYNAMLGIPTEPTEWLPTRNLGMSLSEEDLEELR